VNERAIAAAVEPLLDELLRLERRFDAMLPLPGPKGDPGTSADPAVIAAALAANDAFIGKVRGAAGRDGMDGAGINAPQWEADKVYREGSYVVANLGQHFMAKQDTASSTDDDTHWQRIGSWGFRHRGAFDKDASYRDGDLFVKDWGTFCLVRGTPVLLAGRGALGKAGDKGDKGDKGTDGKDGGTIVAAQVQGFKLVLVQQNADGSLDNLEADFGPAFRDVLRSALEAALPELVETLTALREDVDALQVPRRRAS
jgi:hypothetical protein